MLFSLVTLYMPHTYDVPCTYSIHTDDTYVVRILCPYRSELEELEPNFCGIRRTV